MAIGSQRSSPRTGGALFPKTLPEGRSENEGPLRHKTAYIENCRCYGGYGYKGYGYGRGYGYGLLRPSSANSARPAATDRRQAAANRQRALGHHLAVPKWLNCLAESNRQRAIGYH